MKVTIYFNQTKSNFIKSLKNGTYPNIPRKVEILDEMIYTDLAFQLDLNRDEIDILHNDKSIEKIIEEPEDVMDRSDDILQFSVKYHVIDSGMNHVNGVYILFHSITYLASSRQCIPAASHANATRHVRRLLHTIL